MPKQTEPTTKFKVDISELKKGMQEAQRQIRIANSEFKAATAGMDRWSDSADGVSAKMQQLGKVLDAEKKKLSSLEEQYKLVAKEQGENSKGAQELLIKINNQKAAIGQAEANLQKYGQRLSDITAEQQKSAQETQKQASAYDKLSTEIQQQESDLAGLKTAYASATLEFGKTSNEAKDLAKKISDLSGDLDSNKKAMSDAEGEADDLDKTLGKVEKSAENSGDGFTIMKGAIASLIADGLKALTTAAIDTMKTLTVETEKAYNSFQAQTGTSTKEMEKFKDEMNELYKNNYGESLQDVADAMAEVKQQTKETDPSKLKELTENALALRDTFDMDVKESMRAVNMLMKQFGIDGDDAFNLIAQGAQNGLNKNDDLLDSINEYSVHYKQLGYTSEEFFNSLANGTSSGTFSVDKLGDAMKEFGIRSKDTANTTSEGFELIGLDADEMRKAFVKGGDSAQKATQKTLKGLFNMKDEVKQNQAGVDLFGTMWEDLGKEGVKALMDTNGSLTTTKKSMEEIKQVKYEDVASQFTEIGRTLEMDFLVPLAEKAIPYIKEFADYLINNMDEVTTAIKIVGTTLAAVFVVNKIATFVQSIMTMVTAFTSLKTATEGATVAQRILNLVQKANPMGLLIGALATLTVALGVYAAATDTSYESARKLTDAEQENINKLKTLSDSYDNVTSAAKNSTDKAASQFDYYAKLKDELDSITDKNGKIKKGYEDRAKVITGILNEALGTELSVQSGIVQGLKDESNAIDELIEKKRVQAMQIAYEEQYNTAITNRAATTKELIAVQSDLNKSTSDLAAANADVEHWQTLMANSIDKTGPTYRLYADHLNQAQQKVEGLTDKQKEQKKAVSDAQNKMVDYNATIKNYEGVSAAIVSGDTKKINDALLKLENGFISATDGTEAQLKKQQKNMRNNYTQLEAALRQGTPGVTKEMVKSAKSMVDQADSEYKKLKAKGEKAGKDGGQAVADGVKSKKAAAKKSGKEVSDAANDGAKSANTRKSGEKKGQEYADGVDSKKAKAKTAGKNVSKEGKKGLEETKTKESGENFVAGFVNGLNEKKDDGTLWNAVSNLGKKAINWFNLSLGEQSPSKITYQSGRYFTEGFTNGLVSEMTEVGTAVTQLANKALGTLKKANATEDYESAGESAIKSFENGINKETSAAEKSVEHLVNQATKKAKAKTKDNKTKEAFAKLGEKMVESFSTAYEKAANKAITKIDSKIDSLTSKMQSKIDAVRDLQDDLQDRLAEGDLYSEDDNGQISLTDFNADIANINQFGANLAALKGKVSAEMMDQLAAMDTTSGIKLTSKLLSISDEELAAYNAAYTQKLKASKTIAENYYSDQISNLKKNYTDKVTSEMKKLKKQLSKLGENTIDGFLKGFSSKDKDTTKAVKEFSDSLVKKIKKELGIRSPSKVMRDMVGRFIPAGIAEGIKKNTNSAVNAMSTLANNLVTPMKASVSGVNVNGSASPQMATASASTTNVYNFNQTNNSPKALSRWDIYRQTKNLLGGV